MSFDEVISMCGIVGYVGKGLKLTKLIDSLKRLEYRGYDSAGIAYVNGSYNGQGSLVRYRRVGKIDELEVGIRGELERVVTSAIGHTRWATHGKPDENNAHPHFDCNMKIAVVHNGIIENYKQLFEHLSSRGHKFSSETDSEIIAHLIEDEFNKLGNMSDAFESALKKLKGSFAIAMISAFEPNKLYIARNESPLIIGKLEDGFIVSSDIPAFLPLTRDAFIMENGLWGILSEGTLKVFSLNGGAVKPQFSRISWDISQAEKGGYKHFMLKEIFEQPRVLREVMEGRLKSRGLELEVDLMALANISSITYVACGSSYHAGLLGKYYSWQLAGIPADAFIASEFRYMLSDKLDLEDRLFVFLSQSGETADTLGALRRLKEIAPRAKVIGITNVLGSSLEREVDSISIRAGLEIGVAATKTFSAQVLTLLLLNLGLALERGRMSDKEFDTIKKELYNLPRVIKSILSSHEKVFEVADRFLQTSSMFYLGRNLLYPTALEGALKIKEIAYVHAEGYPAGEMKHGPIALIDGSFVSVLLMGKNSTLQKMQGNYREVVSRGGPVIAVVDELSQRELDLDTDNVITLPYTIPVLQPITFTVPLQLLAYRIADKKGLDVDRPRNLAKSVTVE